MLAKNDLGSRVVVRRFVGFQDERPQFTDVLGELTGLSDTELSVTTSQGVVVVPLAQVHRAKVVPARRGPTAREVAALELAAAEAWPAPVREPLGDWWLRAADGYTGRANSALPVGDPGLPLPRAVDAVVDFYRERGLPPQVDVPLPLASAVERELLARGWHVECTVQVQTCPLDELIAATPDGAQFALADTPSEQLLAMIAGSLGPLPDAARHVLTAVPGVVFAQHFDEAGALLARARGTVTGAGRWLGVFGVETSPAARRRGLAAASMGALARWAAAQGATDAFLQVNSPNTGALALYAGLGFTSHHVYTRYQLR
ncbi:GNAT family N-acetyltransferase [Catellatospora tritici]|uniref:GNAT family N-acetyltransferase n=1 Tax=Catellatospora tritici TaxID=2851566 RepID=UPI001C2D9B1E|nr:GNAT family N-acetyltransferase [Catellatospora tritici]MBV1849050.1 GNAT family N-acetyltransferase [Catellatospora tritici]